jgi:hypothetical protein
MPRHSGRCGCGTRRPVRLVWFLVGSCRRIAARCANESLNRPGTGWPPLSGQYRETLGAARKDAEATGIKYFVSFYERLQDWPERDAVSKLTCPRLIFVGGNDHFQSYGYDIRHAPLIIEDRQELERLGWTVRIVDGSSHDLGGRPDIVIPLLREFLDPLLHG